MPEILSYLVVTLYALCASLLMIYGLNCYVLIHLYTRGKDRAARSCRDMRGRYPDLAAISDPPVVTTQIAVYNEVNVAERCLRAVAAMQWPRDRHEIQVLDDSNDETREIVDAVAADLVSQGYDVRVIRREKRTGFKAGALHEGLLKARGSLVAVFDADFTPPADYLVRTVPFFLEDSRIGLVQARWGHLNRTRSLITRAQSIGIDGHFTVEQSARCWNGLFMNFNGTAGVWRKTAIEDGGGWQWDTLTEDMDLSYRVQFAGWRTVFLQDLVAPAEIPEDVSAFKSQQFRWAKGSIQTALKLFPRLMRQDVSWFKKLQAFFHMTHYMVHPMMLALALLALPVLLILKITLAPVIFAILGMALILAMAAPNALYLVSQRAVYRDWKSRVFQLPILVMIGVGVALSNTRAVAEAIAGRESPFVRTPKRGDREIKRYRVPFPWLAVAEVALGAYCFASLDVYLASGKYLVGPFLAAYASGFTFVGLLTLAQNVTDRAGHRGRGA